MNGNSVALDTNAAIDVLNGRADVGALAHQFKPIYLPVTVVGELYFGALNADRVEENIRETEELIKKCALLEAGISTAREYARLRLELKRKGKPIPDNDLWIAAACLEHNLPLITLDEHFSFVEGLRVMRW